MLEIYAYMTNFTKVCLKYQNSYKDLTKADFYMNFHFYRVSLLTFCMTELLQTASATIPCGHGSEIQYLASQAAPKLPNPIQTAN
jgi:hypothetical protein